MKDWKSTKLAPGAKLLKAHAYTLVHLGNTYSLEIDEYADGSFSGHGEHAADASNVLASVSGNTHEECLQVLVESAQSRQSTD